MTVSPLTIDVVSDVVCPWCFVGKRQLEQALERWQRDSPDRPVERKFGSADTSRIYVNVKRAAAAVGLDLAIEAIVRQPNTLRPHALLEAAAEEGVQDALAEALFTSYFQQARDLTDPTVLREIALGAGLSAAAIDRALDDAQAHQAVAQADLRARRAGIRGVPCFIVNGRSAVSGAQGADAILEAMTLEADDQPDQASA